MDDWIRRAKDIEALLRRAQEANEEYDRIMRKIGGGYTTKPTTRRTKRSKRTRKSRKRSA
jgi:hypothetical protein